MKKVASLLLVLLICASLVACGKEEDYGKYQDLIECIKDRDREGAYAELDRLLPDEGDLDQNTGNNDSSGGSGSAGGNASNSGNSVGSGNSTGNNNSSGSSSGQSKPDYSEVVTTLQGEWIPANEVKEAYSSNMLFRNDNTCVIAGEELTWEIVEQKVDSSKKQTITILDASDATRKRFQCEMYQEDGLYEIKLGVWEDGAYRPNSYFKDVFFRAADYQAVTVTKENWDQYFENFYEIVFNKNAFGEVDGANIMQYLLSKPEYKINGETSSVAVAYEKVPLYQEYTADPQTGAFSLGNVVSIEESWKLDTTDTMSTVKTNTDNTGRYGLFYLHGTCVIKKFPSGTVYRDGNYTITRIEGTIYIQK